MISVLDTIIAHARTRVAHAKERIPFKVLEESVHFSVPSVSLSHYLLRPDLNGIIAEIKRRSPSRGVLSSAVSIEHLSLGYMQAGASALSVLTEPHYFGGSLADLTTARHYNFCPILRKDFIVDEYQIVEAKAAGADAILLIAAALSAPQVRSLATMARSLGLEVLAEVHHGDELERVLIPEIHCIALASAEQHIGYLEELGFQQYVVSLKSSDPNDVVAINTEFAKRFPEVPLHLGVTEAGLLPMGEIKTRVAFEHLLARGIGDTVRVSLTLPNDRKHEEILVGKAIIDDVYAGRFRSVPTFDHEGLNIISCPSCSRVENSAFVELAEKVRSVAHFAEQDKVTIAVMGCRVNGPGETDDADLGLWCAPSHVNFKRKGELIGAFSYDEILPRFEAELRTLVEAKRASAQPG